MKLYLLLILASISTLASAQDYFQDRHGNGNPIIFSADGSHNLLFSAGVNVSDKSSVKANLYRQYWLNESTYQPLAVPRQKDFLGWGVSIKANLTNGLGSLFSAGNLNAAFNGGAYLAYTQLTWKTTADGKGTYYSNWALILSQNLNYASYQFFNPAQPYNNQLSVHNFHGQVTALSYVLQLHPKKDNLLIGASLSFSHRSNFDNLQSVLITNDSLISGAGKVRTVQETNDNGNIYAFGRFQEYTNYNFRLNATFIPAAFEYKVGFTIYPSVDISPIYRVRYNAGLALSYLKDKSPSTPIASLIFEFDDLNNSSNRQGSFLSRSFNVSIATSLNILTGTR